jgi:hypothetical protein
LIIWHESSSFSWRSKTFCGGDSPSIDQWYTALPVTMAMLLGAVHRQKTTASVRLWLFIFERSSRLKIWRVWPERRARTCVAPYPCWWW